MAHCEKEWKCVIGALYPARDRPSLESFDWRESWAQVAPRCTHDHLMAIKKQLIIQYAKKIDFDSFFATFESGDLDGAIGQLKKSIGSLIHGQVDQGAVPVLKELLHRSIRDAIGMKCNARYFRLGAVIVPYLRRKLAMFVACMDQFNFDSESQVHAVRLGDEGQVERLSQAAITAELATFGETLSTLRDLRMTLMLDIYIEEVVRDEIQHKVEDEYSAVFDEAKEIGG